MPCKPEIFLLNMDSNKQIDFYLDFTSPYAYLASTQIEALAAMFDYSVVWRPFLIGATFKTTGRKPLIQHPLVWEYSLQDVQRTARLLGQPINIPVKFPILSVKPGRLFYYFQQRDGDQQVAKNFASAVFQAYFLEQKDITDNHVLGQLCAAFGVDEGQVDEIVKSTEMKARFKTEVDTAIARNVFGAPMFIVRNEMFWGVDRLGQLGKWLQTGGW
jgi:2-hydroxychromene-2-carboxylate isomerase